MEEYGNINSILRKVYGYRIDEIYNVSLKTKDLRILKLRDILIETGLIQYEDLENQIYVATIMSGLFKSDYAIVAFELKGDILNIASYGEKGVFKKHANEGVINDIKKSIKQYLIED